MKQCPWCFEAIPEEPQPEPEQDHTVDYLDVSFHFGDISNQAEFVKALCKCRGNELAGFFAKMLEPGGWDGWRLILKRPGRGAPPTKWSPGHVTHFYEEAVRRYGKRGALKHLLGKFPNETLDSIRSAVRRETGTHSKRRKPSGRK